MMQNRWMSFLSTISMVGFIWLFCLGNGMIAAGWVPEDALADDGPIILDPAGLKVDPVDPYQLQFLFGLADEHFPVAPKVAHHDAETLIRYFFAALAVPGSDLWVNLSPTEPERVIPPALAQTLLGRDLLAQDFALKRLTARLLHPDTTTGAQFWKDNRDVSMSVERHLGKVWIVPDKADLYVQGEAAMISDASLGVRFLDEVEMSRPMPSQFSETKILKSAIQDEIEHSATFSRLRKIYRAIILSYWFKRHVQHNPLVHSYAGQNRIDGIADVDQQWSQQQYQKYLQHFESATSGWLKESYDPLSQKMVLQKYVTGGITLPRMTPQKVNNFVQENDNYIQVTVGATTSEIDAWRKRLQKTYAHRLQVDSPRDEFSYEPLDYDENLINLELIDSNLRDVLTLKSNELIGSPEDLLNALLDEGISSPAAETTIDKINMILLRKDLINFLKLPDMMAKDDQILFTDEFLRNDQWLRRNWILFESHYRKHLKVKRIYPFVGFQDLQEGEHLEGLISFDGNNLIKSQVLKWLGVFHDRSLFKVSRYNKLKYDNDMSKVSFQYSHLGIGVKIFLKVLKINDELQYRITFLDYDEKEQLQSLDIDYTVPMRRFVMVRPLKYENQQKYIIEAGDPAPDKVQSYKNLIAGKNIFVGWEDAKGTFVQWQKLLSSYSFSANQIIELLGKTADDLSQNPKEIFGLSRVLDSDPTSLRFSLYGIPKNVRLRLKSDSKGLNDKFDRLRTWELSFWTDDDRREYVSEGFDDQVLPVRPYLLINEKEINGETWFTIKKIKNKPQGIFKGWQNLKEGSFIYTKEIKSSVAFSAKKVMAMLGLPYELADQKGEKKSFILSGHNESKGANKMVVHPNAVVLRESKKVWRLIFMTDENLAKILPQTSVADDSPPLWPAEIGFEHVAMDSVRIERVAELYNDDQNQHITYIIDHVKHLLSDLLKDLGKLKLHLIPDSSETHGFAGWQEMLPGDVKTLTYDMANMTHIGESDRSSVLSTNNQPPLWTADRQAPGGILMTDQAMTLRVNDQVDRTATNDLAHPQVLGVVTPQIQSMKNLRGYQVESLFFKGVR